MNTPKSLTRYSRFSAAIFLLIVLLRWQVLQVAAWCWMLGSYTMTHGFSFAWRETFSGNRPCPICHLLSSGRAAEADLWTTLAGQPLLLTVPIAFTVAVATAPIISRMVSSFADRISPARIS